MRCLRRLFPLLCMAPLLLWALSARAGLTLEAAQQRALSDNPRLAQIAARYEAAKQVPEQARSLPDPSIQVGLLSLPTDTFDFDQEAMTQLQLGVSQPLPWFGKLSLAESIARYRAKATAAELAEAQNNLKRDVARGWWTLSYLDHALQVVDENLLRLREFNRVAQSRYRVGKGVQQDALQAQLELSSQLEQQLALQGQRRVMQARLNALMGAQPDQPLQLQEPAQLELTALPDAEQLIDRGLAQRPKVLQQQHLLAAARERVALAEKGLFPDMTLGAAYGYRQDAPNGNDRADLVSVTLGFKLPLYAASKQQREIGQRGAERIAQQQALYDAQLSVRREVVEALTEYQQARERSRLLQQGLMPQARLTVASMYAGYQVNKVDFTALVRAQLQVNRIHLQYWQAVRDAQQARADLVAAVGGEINE